MSDTDDQQRPNVEYGDRDVARGNEILRTVVGSGVHGIAIKGTDDHDEMGVFVEPPEYVVGTRPPMDHYIYRTQPEGARSGPGDLDLVMYSVRRYVRLAAKGNPTALLPLFAPESAVVVTTRAGRDLRRMAGSFLSLQAVERFLGYMHGQHERMMGRGKQNRVPNRPELIEQYGWDVKYGAHALRLAYQGVEIAVHGHLTLPMPDSQREHVLAVKRGERSRDAVSDDITRLELKIRGILNAGASPLPAEPDWPAIDQWMQRVHREHWDWT